MTTNRALLATLVAAALVSSACDSAPDADRSPSSTDTASSLSGTTPSSTAGPTDTARPDSPEGAPTMRTARTSVRVDGGRLEVAGDGSALVVVAVTTEPEWEVEIERPSDQRLDASFTSGGDRTDVTVILTVDGIRSTTRSTRSG